MGKDNETFPALKQLSEEQVTTQAPLKDADPAQLREPATCHIRALPPQSHLDFHLGTDVLQDKRSRLMVSLNSALTIPTSVLSFSFLKNGQELRSWVSLHSGFTGCWPDKQLPHSRKIPLLRTTSEFPFSGVPRGRKEEA